MPQSNVQQHPVIDVPTGHVPAAQHPKACTCDALIDLVSTNYCLGNALVWDYAMNASQNPSVAFLTMAAKGLHITGELRKTRKVQAMIDNFWDLHSKYIAPSASEVRLIYVDILGHILSLHDAYGAAFWQKGAEQHLVELLARECGPPDESEESVRQHAGSLNRLLEKGLRNLFTEWLSMWGNIPDSKGPTKDRVSMTMCEKWYFREDGVIAFCIRMMQEFMNSLINPVQVPTKIEGQKTALELFIQWDYDNRGNFKYLPFKILLAMPCNYERQRVTQLKRTFWDSVKVQYLADNLNKNNLEANEISGLFIYSMVDPGHGAHALLDLQKQRMEGVDKTRNSYDMIRTEHERMSGPPFRTRNAEWSDDVMENTNYDAVQNILDNVVIPPFQEPPEEPSQEPLFPPRNEEPAEDKPVVDVPPFSPPEEDVQMGEEPTPDEPEQVEENNVLLFGGLAALTLGIGAVALSRRRS